MQIHTLNRPLNQRPTSSFQQSYQLNQDLLSSPTTPQPYFGDRDHVKGGILLLGAMTLLGGISYMSERNTPQQKPPAIHAELQNNPDNINHLVVKGLKSAIPAERAWAFSQIKFSTHSAPQKLLYSLEGMRDKETEVSQAALQMAQTLCGDSAFEPETRASLIALIKMRSEAPESLNYGALEGKLILQVQQLVTPAPAAPKELTPNP